MEINVNKILVTDFAAGHEMELLRKQQETLHYEISRKHSYYLFRKASSKGKRHEDEEIFLKS